MGREQNSRFDPPTQHDSLNTEVGESPDAIGYGSPKPISQNKNKTS